MLATIAAAADTRSTADGAFPGRNGLIAFTSDRDGDGEIFTIRPDGRQLRRLTRNVVEDGCPSWSPDGRRIAFSREYRYGRSDMFVMRADGSGLSRVLRSPGSDTCPVWSPDGRWLAFTRNVIATEPRDRIDDIHVVRVDGRGLRRLTLDGAHNVRPAWSVRSRIAWQSLYGSTGFNDIWTMRTDGSDRRRVTRTESNTDAHWSPDGRWIVFTGIDNLNPHDHELFVVGADGSGLRKLTETEHEDLQPAWSPDGRSIVYAYAAVPGNIDLHVIRPDGRGRRRITRGRGHDRDPDWGRAR